MIKRAVSSTELDILPEKGIEAQKIRALLNAYGVNYEFCRFFISENTAIAMLYGDCIICEFGKTDIEELCEFLGFNGFTEIFCSISLGEAIQKYLKVKTEQVNLMRFKGSPTPRKLTELCPENAYNIIKTCFDIDFETWYPDMSHFVRHGVSKLYGLDGSALAVQFDINGEALLSQISTLPEKRGQGCASSLISAVCAAMPYSEIYVLCEDKLKGFYEKNGFVFADKKSILFGKA